MICIRLFILVISYYVIYTLYFVLGSSEVPRKVAGRIFFLSLLIFTFVVYQFYTCSIVSTLLTAPPRTIHKLSDIMKNHLTVGIEDILTARDTLHVIIIQF